LEVENLRITDWLKNTELSESASYQDILIYVGKREKETYEYYRSLSERYRGNEIGKLFSTLANEELTHKNRIEREYDKYVLTEM
jgi:rubrerythrin